MRNFLAAADVCVIPSIRTRGFREPWGLVANEAMNQSTPVIASDEVGAAAGGLVRHERNGLVVPAGDVPALAGALRRLHDDPALRGELGANARRDVAAYTFEAWAAGFAGALDSVRARAVLATVSRDDAPAHPPRRSLALLAVAAPAAGSGLDVIRDCTDDEVMSKTYTQKEYRDALRELAADIDQYTNCRDVIQRAQAAAAAGKEVGRGRRSGTGSGPAGAPAGGGRRRAAAPARSAARPPTSSCRRPAPPSARPSSRRAASAPGAVSLDDAAVDAAKVGTAPGVSSSPTCRRRCSSCSRCCSPGRSPSPVFASDALSTHAALEDPAGSAR